MKIVKYVFLLLLLAAIAVTVFIATQEGRYDIKKERVIKVPKTVLYNYINDYRNWENAGILTGNDTTAIFTYSGKTYGQGAVMSWKRPGNEGKVKTVRTTENDSIFQKATINGLEAEMAWGFKDTLGSTKVTVRLQGELNFTDKAYAVLKGGMDKKIESSLESGLENLNNFLIHELSVYDIDVQPVLIHKTGKYYLGHAITSKIADISKKSAEVFPRLMAFAKENKIALNGMPFLLYRKLDKARGVAAYLVCIPIKEQIFTAPGSEFEGGEVTPFKALKTTLKGDYSHLKKAWDAAARHIAQAGLQENTTGQYLEIYTKGMRQTRKPSQWITDIYIPIGPPTVTPAETIPGPPVPGTAPQPAARPVQEGPSGTRQLHSPAATPLNRPQAAQPIKQNTSAQSTP